MNELPEQTSGEAELVQARAKVARWIIASILLFFFGLPAGCFGCAAAGGGGGVLFPFLASFANLGALLAWMMARAKLPENERNPFAIIVVIVMALVILTFLSIMAESA